MPSSNVTITATAMSVNEDRSAASLADVETTSGDIFSPLPPGDRLAQRLGFVDVVASVDRGADAFAMHVYGDRVTSSAAGASPGFQSVDTTTGTSLEWQHAAGNVSYGLSARIARGNAESDGPFAQPLENGSDDTAWLLRANAAYHPNKRSEVDASLEDVWDAAGFAPTGTAFDEHTFIAPQARLAWSQLLQPGLSIRAGLGSSGVLPTLDALSGSRLPAVTSSVTTVERANGGDIGLEWRLHGNTTTFSADLYHTGTTGVYTITLGSAAPLLPAYNWVNGLFRVRKFHRSTPH